MKAPYALALRHSNVFNYLKMKKITCAFLIKISFTKSIDLKVEIIYAKKNNIQYISFRSFFY